MPKNGSDKAADETGVSHMQETTGSASYKASDITVLEGLEAVRKRPGMYIGSTGERGLHHLVYEVVDNSVDEALAGHCDSVEIRLHPDNRVTVTDNGRGIPVDMHEKEQRPAAEVVLTVLHAGGKFGDGGGYKVSGGLHGVGVSVVNALSEHLDLVIKRDGHVWTQAYERGVPQAPLTKGEPTKEHGTTITFLPDLEIFDEISFDFETLAQRMRETAFLTRGLRIEIVDERGSGERAEFQYEGGIRDFVAYLNQNKDPIHRKIVYFEGSTDDGQGEISMQWNSSYQESIFSFANNINTPEGGTHLSGFRSALTRTLNDYARKKGLLKEKDDSLAGEDVREGLTAIVSVKLHDPQFEGQTKAKLGNPQIKGFVESTVNRKLGEFLEENPAEANQIIGKAIAASRARDAARKARDLTRRKSALENSTLPGKLADCSVKDSGARGALHRRGRLGRRQRQAGARSQHAGRAAAARQDHQRREEPHRQGALERGDPVARDRDRHRHARGVRPREPALPQGDPDDGRRRGRRAHPHARADVPVPRDAGPDRCRPRLHRKAAAVPHEDRQQGAVHREGVGARGDAAARQARQHRGSSITRARRSTSPSSGGSASRGWSRSTRAGPRRCARSTATGRGSLRSLEESQILDQGLTDVDKVVAELKKKAPARRALRHRGPLPER